MSVAKHKTLTMPELVYRGRLDGKDWRGADGASWRDIAVDSGSNPSAVVWVRRRIKDGAYFLIVSVLKGHVLAYQLTTQEAKELYYALPDRAPYKRAFDPEKKNTKRLRGVDKR